MKAFPSFISVSFCFLLNCHGTVIEWRRKINLALKWMSLFQICRNWMDVDSCRGLLHLPCLGQILHKMTFFIIFLSFLYWATKTKFIFSPLKVSHLSSSQWMTFFIFIIIFFLVVACASFFLCCIVLCYQNEKVIVWLSA